MIYTVTTNPAVDLNLRCDGLRAKAVNRTYGAVYTPNGKGVNVARVLRHFGREAEVLGFFGGFTGRYIVDALKAEGYRVRPVWLRDITRVNVFLNDGTDEYKLVGEGAEVPPEKQQELLAMLEKAAAGGTAVFSGSLSKGMDGDYYDALLERCAARGIRAVLDISSPKLRGLLCHRPLLIKPNDEELRDIFGITLETERHVWEAMRFLRAEGAENILLTMGERGMYFYGGGDLYRCTAAQVELVSSACAGDGALAAFLCHWLGGAPVEDSLRVASAVGADIAASEGVGRLERYPSLMERVQVAAVPRPEMDEL